MTEPRYALCPGVEWVALGAEGFAAFSPLSGETHLLNAECVEVLACVLEHGPSSTQELVNLLAAEYEIEPSQLGSDINGTWRVLLDGGLVREHVHAVQA